MIEGSSDKLRDAWIAKSIIDRLSPLSCLVSLCSTRDRATNTGGDIESERIAIADAACAFVADTVGIETVAEGSSGKRLCLPAGCASG
jgi:hypothetical protein